MRRYCTSALLLLIAVVILGHAAPASAITGDEFRLRSGADIVALCAASATGPVYTAAVHMSHGFGAGTFQTIMALSRQEKVPRRGPGSAAQTMTMTSSGGGSAKLVSR